MKRVLAVIALMAAALIVGQGTALAHNVLLNTDPADGASVPVGPREVHLSFNEPVRPGYDTVTVVGPGGTYWTDAQPQIAGSTVVEPVHQLGPAGAYVVSYRILSNDGHPVEGKVTFNLTKPGTGTPVPPPNGTVAAASQSSHAGGMPIWPWLVAAVVLVAVGLLLALRLGRPSDKR
jgi:copper resistance protein C